MLFRRNWSGTQQPGNTALTGSHIRDEPLGIVNVEWLAPLKDPHVCKAGGIFTISFPMLFPLPEALET